MYSLRHNLFALCALGAALVACGRTSLDEVVDDGPDGGLGGVSGIGGIGGAAAGIAGAAGLGGKAGGSAGAGGKAGSAGAIAGRGGSGGIAGSAGRGGTGGVAGVAGGVAGGAGSNASIKAVEIRPNDQTVRILDKPQFQFIAIRTDGTEQDLTNFAVWTSSNLQIALDQGNGFFLARAAGTVTITAKSSAFAQSGTATLRVLSGDVQIALTPPGASEVVGKSVTFTAERVNPDGTREPIDAGTCSWRSNLQGVASVQSPGVIVCRGAGSAVISVQCNGRPGSAQILCSEQPLAIVRVTPSESTVPNGTRLQFNATAYFQDGTTQPITTQATWASDDTAVAIVGNTGANQKGIVTATGAGTTNITATYAGATGKATITVNP